MMPNALLLSASREGETGYLEHAIPLIKEFLESLNLATTPNVLFIPYAGVSVTFDQYHEMVHNALADLNINFSSIHQHDNEKQAIDKADVIFVGGGNTFALLDRLYKADLVEYISTKVQSGKAYIGWSAGSNIAGASIKTTNDMPIVEPQSFDALNIVPFQLNPHYTEYQAPGHNGETREMRLQEFMVVNPDTTIVGIQEGSALRLSSNGLCLLGKKVAFEFKAGMKTEVEPHHSFNHLLGNNL
ncbi:dipeptidase PepE [Psychrosphaera haliotis]|uniref:dipeptidase PepE n=1 Tax=Psychrosphaera haliotis TaxID=555083 RepID=UPI002375ED18|nr:dipeptidase PepE [Psychrosphaera haliotis]